MLQNNLSFKMSTVREAVNIIGNENKVGWKLNDAHFNDWVTTITARLRNMMFVIGRDMRKKQPAEWVHKLFDEASIPDSPSSAGARREFRLRLYQDAPSIIGTYGLHGIYMSTPCPSEQRRGNGRKPPRGQQQRQQQQYRQEQ